MSAIHRKLCRFVVAALFATSILAISGCIPTAWLPDSSGFVYVKPLKGKAIGEPGSGQLVHFDLKTKASRVVVNDINGTTLWPAVSPDGKRVAIARFKGKQKEPKTVQVVIYDMQGKQLHQSKDLAWTPAGGDNFFGSMAMLFWSPKDDQVVITDLQTSGVYSVKTDSVKVYEKLVPTIHGGSPIRPDGKGFLAVIETKDTKKPRLVFMDWAGKETPINTEAFEKAMDAKSKDKGKAGDSVGALVMGMFLPSGWQGNTAWTGFKRMKWTYEIDTVKNSVSIADKFAELLTEIKGDKKDNEPFRFDFAGDFSVHIHQFKEAQPPKEFNKVVIFNHKTGKENVILPKIPGAFLFSPSPDGNYLTLGIGQFGGITGDPLNLLVISSKGELLSNINLQ